MRQSDIMPPTEQPGSNLMVNLVIFLVATVVGGVIIGGLLFASSLVIYLLTLRSQVYRL
jgi:hypothetical protein